MIDESSYLVFVFQNCISFLYTSVNFQEKVISILAVNITIIIGSLYVHVGTEIAQR